MCVRCVRCSALVLIDTIVPVSCSLHYRIVEPDVRAYCANVRYMSGKSVTVTGNSTTSTTTSRYGRSQLGAV